jgi:hypothetical protein
MACNAGLTTCPNEDYEVKHLKKGRFLMKGLARFVMVSLGVVALVFVTGLSYAGEGGHYKVVITNLTRGQIISPPVIISHNRDFRLFTPGEPASPELVALAEDGITNDLADELSTRATVFDYTVASDPLMPGSSASFEIRIRGRFRFFSAAGMLVTTNDAFFAVRGVRVPRTGEIRLYANAYDAGSEGNSESCTFIPGPPCLSAGARDTQDAEGTVHIHAGIHGIGDLDPAAHDWRNPVVGISIQKMD